MIQLENVARKERALKEVPLGGAPKEVPLGGAPKEVLLGGALKEVPLGGSGLREQVSRISLRFIRATLAGVREDVDLVIRIE